MRNLTELCFASEFLQARYGVPPGMYLVLIHTIVGPSLFFNDYFPTQDHLRPRRLDMHVIIPAIVAGSPIPIPTPSAILSLPLMPPPLFPGDGPSVGLGALVPIVDVDVASSMITLGVVFGSLSSV